MMTRRGCLSDVHAVQDVPDLLIHGLSDLSRDTTQENMESNAQKNRIDAPETVRSYEITRDQFGGKL